MRNLIFVGAMALSLAACNDSATEFVGHWEQVGKDCSSMDIEKNGETMLIRVHAPGMFKRESAAFPGVMNGETLNVTIRGTVQAMLINKNTGNLLVASDEYKRVAKEKECTPTEPRAPTIEELRKQYSPSLIEKK